MIRLFLLLSGYKEAFLKASVRAVCVPVIIYHRWLCGIYYLKNQSAGVVNVIMPISQVMNLDFDIVQFSFRSQWLIHHMAGLRRSWKTLYTHDPSFQNESCCSSSS